jgi:hypothetical protein
VAATTHGVKRMRGVERQPVIRNCLGPPWWSALARFIDVLLIVDIEVGK